MRLQTRARGGIESSSRRRKRAFPSGGGPRHFVPAGSDLRGPLEPEDDIESCSYVALASHAAPTAADAGPRPFIRSGSSLGR